jgi:DNA-directed RNA polymerase specialized sigma24 family protein
MDRLETSFRSKRKEVEMSSTGSVTGLLNQLQQGDRDIVQHLWELYFGHLVRLARKKLRNVPRAARDEEDVALSAFDSFCRAAELGRFPQLADRDDLWQVLVLITARKACDLREYEGRDKRDWRRVQQEAEGGGELSWRGSVLSGVLSREPDPAWAAEVAEESRGLLEKLRDEELRQIAMRKLEGYSNEEIADRVGCALSTVERRLKLIRTRWKEKEPPVHSGESKEDRP